MSGRAIAERWFAQKLAGITYKGEAVRVYRHPAPTTAKHPFISISIISAVDLYQMGNTSDYERLQYAIRVWDAGTSALRVNDIAKQIHRRVNAVEPEFFDDGYVVSCTRVGALAPDTYEEQNGEIYQSDGGLYRVHIVTYNN